MENLQKLSLALLVLILATLIFSLFQVRNTYQIIDEIPSRLEKSSSTSARLKRELSHLDKLQENLKRSSDRHSELLLSVDVRLKSSFDLESLDSWRSKTGLLRAQLSQDLGRLQQFNAETNPELNKLVVSLKGLLLQEDAQWISLQQFLDMQVDETDNPNRSNQFYQNYMQEFLGTIRALSVFRGAVNEYRDRLQALVNSENLKFMKIETRSKYIQNSLQHYLIVIIVCVVMGIIASCGVYGLRIRRERRSRERRKVVRSVENERRKIDRHKS